MKFKHCVWKPSSWPITEQESLVHSPESPNTPTSSQDLVNDCKTNPCNSHGDLNAECTNLDRPIPWVPNFLCTCSEGFNFSPSQNTCVANNPCHNSPCHNNGRCNWEGGNSYHCTCTPTYEGSDCEIEVSHCQ